MPVLLYLLQEFGVEFSDVPPVSDKGVPVQIISYLISVRVSDVLPVSDKGVSEKKQSLTL
jgi:hypothetical protein